MLYMLFALSYTLEKRGEFFLSVPEDKMIQNDIIRQFDIKFTQANFLVHPDGHKCFITQYGIMFYDRYNNPVSVFKKYSFSMIGDFYQPIALYGRVINDSLYFFWDHSRRINIFNTSGKPLKTYILPISYNLTISDLIVNDSTLFIADAHPVRDSSKFEKAVTVYDIRTGAIVKRFMQPDLKRIRIANKIDPAVSPSVRMAKTPDSKLLFSMDISPEMYVYSLKGTFEYAITQTPYDYIGVEKSHKDTLKKASSCCNKETANEYIKWRKSFTNSYGKPSFLNDTVFITYRTMPGKDSFYIDFYNYKERSYMGSIKIKDTPAYARDNIIYCLHGFKDNTIEVTYFAIVDTSRLKNEKKPEKEKITLPDNAKKIALIDMEKKKTTLFNMLDRKKPNLIFINYPQDCFFFGIVLDILKNYKGLKDTLDVNPEIESFLDRLNIVLAFKHEDGEALKNYLRYEASLQGMNVIGISDFLGMPLRAYDVLYVDRKGRGLFHKNLYEYISKDRKELLLKNMFYDIIKSAEEE